MASVDSPEDAFVKSHHTATSSHRFFLCKIVHNYKLLGMTIKRMADQSMSELISGCEDMFTHVRNVETCAFSVLNLER